MHEFVFLPIRREAAEAINHVPTYAPTDPDVAVDDPDDISLRLAIAPTHVPDFRVRAQVVGITMLA